MSTTKRSVSFVVHGEPASKANTRKIVHLKVKGGGVRPAVIKSEKALNYEETFRYQCPEIDPLFEGDVAVEIYIYYTTRKPDLDESVILDCMQAHREKLPNGEVLRYGGVYLNDRQVKEKHVFWGLDKADPRAEITVREL